MVEDGRIFIRQTTTEATHIGRVIEAMTQLLKGLFLEDIEKDLGMFAVNLLWIMLAKKLEPLIEHFLGLRKKNPASFAEVPVIEFMRTHQNALLT